MDDSSKITWEYALGKWIDAQRGAGTRRDYQRIWERFAGFCAKRPWEVQAEDVAAWKGTLEQDGYALSTLRTYLATLRSFYTFAGQRVSMGGWGI
jgi:site-specific recombinase XerD